MKPKRLKQTKASSTKIDKYINTELSKPAESLMLNESLNE